MHKQTKRRLEKQEEIRKLELLADLRRLPNFKQNELTSCDYVGECDLFRIRWFWNENTGWWDVQFGVKETIDRWANSTDFQTHLCFTQFCYRRDILAEYEWMVDVLKSGLFDFNSYIGTIDCHGKVMILNE
jgi:hypothetical protein